MKDIFKGIITDFLEKSLDTVYQRDMKISAESTKIITISGARRVGKTYFLYSLIKEMRNKLKNNVLVYINFENERLYPYKTEYLNLFVEAYYELFPLNRSETVYFFFDEIQNVPQWELFVRRLYDNQNCRIFITGSSSKMLSKDIATSLRGRTLNYELFPLSFKEYVQIKHLDTNVYSSQARSFLLNAFNWYVAYTSFPEIIELPVEDIRKSLKEFYDLLIYRDLIERYHIGNTALIKYLTKFLFVNTANFVSYNKLYNDLKSQGFSVGRGTVYEYMEHLHDSYSIFTTSLFTQNIREQQRNARKLYCLDNGLKNLVSIVQNTGRSLENVVFLQLRRQFQDIYYYKGKQEIDFCYQDAFNNIRLINVSETIENQSTFEREIKGLFEAMKYFGIDNSILLTSETEQTITETEKTIHVVPVWKWLLFGSN